MTRHILSDASTQLDEWFQESKFKQLEHPIYCRAVERKWKNVIIFLIISHLQQKTFHQSARTLKKIDHFIMKLNTFYQLLSEAL